MPWSAALGRFPALILDPDKMRQLLLNLLRNALIATDSGGVISVAVARKEGMAELIVSDSGQGIPADDIEHDF